MAKLPSFQQLSGPDPLRSGRAIASYDTSAIGAGIASLGGSLTQIGNERKAQQSTLDITRAEAYKTEGLLGIQNEFDQDPDYSTFEKRAPSRTGDVIKKAADLIRDPQKRELWLAGAQGDAARVNDGIFDVGTKTQKNAELIAFDDALEVSRRLYVDPDTPEDIKTKARRDIEASISMAQETGLLDPVTAEARRKAFVEDADFSRGQLAVARDPSIIAPTGGMAQIIRKEEGFRPGAYWDVNAWRTGYGSDTVTRADGRVEKVTEDTVVTKADAERDLSRRMKEFEGTATSQVGAEAWSVLPENVRGPLVSVAYNYGKLPSSVVAAVRSGDVGAIADAVGSLSANKDRRQREAAIIRGAASMPIGDAPGWYKNLSPERRAALDEQASTYQRQAAANANAQLTAERAAIKDSFSLRIATDDATLQEREILDNTVIDDGAKAALINSLRTQTKEARETAAALESFGRGALNVDPYDSAGRKIVDNMFNTASKAVAPEQVQPLGEEIVRQSGIVPQPMMNAIRRDLGSTDPEAVMRAAQSAYRISTLNPAALGRREGGAEAQAAADDFAFYVDRLNLSPEDAARRLMDARDPQKQRDRKALEPLAKEFVKKMQDVDIANEFDTWFGAEPALGFTPAQEAGLKAEFLAIAEDQFYSSNGDKDVAQNRAMAEFKRIYGVSELTGKKVVIRNPPERYWPARNGFFTDPHGYAKEQLAADGLSADPTFNMDTLQLVPTRETEAMIKRGEMPGYAVMWTDENGVLQTMPGKLWRPDVTETRAISEAERAAIIEDAQQKDADIRAGRDREQSLENFLAPPDVFGDQ